MCIEPGKSNGSDEEIYKAQKTDQDQGIQTQTPGLQTQTAGLQTQTAGLQTQAPGVQTQAPGVHAQAPGMQTQAPLQQQPVESVMPLSVMEKNAQLQYQIQEKGETVNASRAAGKTTQQGTASQEESKKERKEREKKEKAAREAHCFMGTAGAYDMQQICANRERIMRANQQTLQTAGVRDQYYLDAFLQDTQKDKTAESRNKDLIRAFTMPGMEKEKQKQVDQIRDRLMRYHVDQEIFTRNVDIKYIRENLDEVLTLREQFAAFDMMKADPANAACFKNLDPAFEKRYLIQRDLFYLYYAEFSARASVEGVDIDTGKYLQREEQAWKKMAGSEERKERFDELTAAKRQATEARKEEILHKEALVHDLKKDQESDGGCSYHQIVDRDEAAEAVSSSNGFLYAQKTEDGMYELRATLPEFVKIPGNDQFPLRRTYNQYVKALHQIVIKRDADGNPILRSVKETYYKNKSVEEFYPDLMGALQNGNPDGAKLRKEMLERPLRELYGGKWEEVYGNIEIFVTAGIKNDAYVDGGVDAAAAMIDILKRINYANAKEPSLAKRKETLRKEMQKQNVPEETIRAREEAMDKIHEFSREAEAEMLSILEMDDDEIDVPLPNTCKDNANFLCNVGKCFGEKTVKEDGSVEEATFAAREPWLYESMSDQVPEHHLFYAKQCLEDREEVNRVYGSEKGEALSRRALLGVLRHVLLDDTKKQNAEGTADAAGNANAAPKVQVSTEVRARLARWMKEVLAQEQETAKNDQEKQGEKPVVKADRAQRAALIEDTSEWLEKNGGPQEAAEPVSQQEREQREEDLKAILAQIDMNYAREHTDINIFGESQQEQIQMFYFQRGKYEFHYAKQVAEMKGKTVTVECFAPETKEYVKSAFTRSKKGVGIYRKSTEAEKAKAGEQTRGRRKAAWQEGGGFIKYYNKDNPIPGKVEQEHAKAKTFAATQAEGDQLDPDYTMFQ